MTFPLTNLVQNLKLCKVSFTQHFWVYCLIKFASKQAFTTSKYSKRTSIRSFSKKAFSLVIIPSHEDVQEKWIQSKIFDFIPEDGLTYNSIKRAWKGISLLLQIPFHSKCYHEASELIHTNGIIYCCLVICFWFRKVV